MTTKARIQYMVSRGPRQFADRSDLARDRREAGEVTILPGVYQSRVDAVAEATRLHEL
jgi:hypothetical protein